MGKLANEVGSLYPSH